MGLLDADKIQSMEAFGDDTCELLEVIEKSFGIEFTDDELVAAKTIGLLGECVSQKLLSVNPKSGSCSPPEVLSAIRQLIVLEIGVKDRTVTAETRFPEGLHIY